MSEQNDFSDIYGGDFNFGDDTAVDPFASDNSDEFEEVTADIDPFGDDDNEEQATEAVQPEVVKEAPKHAPNPKPTDNVAEVDFNPLAQAVEKADTENVKQSAGNIFTRPAEFTYGGAKEPITDATMTFEQLRIAKLNDFPELEDAKKVSWSVEYGKINKTVPKPSDTVIATLKEEIESSKEFLEALKKSKDKDFVCKVKPKITAQSKGILPDYKGVFTNVEDAERSGKAIQILPARDGKIYEIRSNESGKFVVPVENVVELSEVSAGFYPVLPPVPFSLICEIIAFFRYYMSEQEFEALVHIYWDKELEKYHIAVPKQQVTKASVMANLSDDSEFSSRRYVHFADIHSHNSMSARFSKIDDDDEKATRVYMVVGKLDRFFPQISARISCGGRFLPIPISSVIEGMPSEFPQNWTEYVTNTGYHNMEGAI